MGLRLAHGSHPVSSKPNPQPRPSALCRRRGQSLEELRGAARAETPQLRLRLTCVDASDDVSLLRTGAIWDPRLLSLLQPEDQIRLGDWVSWWRTSGSCRPRPPTAQPRLLPVLARGLSPLSILPGPGSTPLWKIPHSLLSGSLALMPTALLPSPSPHLHLRGACPSLSPDSSLLQASGEHMAQRPELDWWLPRTRPPGSHTPQGPPLCQKWGHPCGFPAPPSPRPWHSRSHLSDS